MKLVWSVLARADLFEIRRYSLARWGRDVAVGYLQDIRNAAAADPDGLRSLKGPYRVRRVRSHYLVLHVDPDAPRLTVARILHVSMDLERHLPGRDAGKV